METISKVVGIIPVRLASKRLPRKALRIIQGHTMIEWVYRRAHEWPGFSRLLVATDSEEVTALCSQLGIPVMLTSSRHRSGAERVIEVMNRLPADLYINIQGDEPMVTGHHMELLVAPFRERPGTAVTTLKVEVTPEAATNPNDVKVVTSHNGRALYFSRSSIPYDRAGTGATHYYKHMGLYAYSAQALQAFSTLAPSELETAEALEQLRFLENGIPIVVIETAEDTIGVDTEDDLKRVEEYFRQANVSMPEVR